MKDNVKAFIEALQLYDCGLEKIRLGNAYDGGYVLFKKGCEESDSLYSFGIGDDISFENALVSSFKNIDSARLFDPTVDNVPAASFNDFKFYHEGIEGNMFFKDDSPTVKIDVEWNEWQALAEIEECELAKIKQLVIEFHLVHAQAQPGLSPYFTNFYDTIFAMFNDNLFEQYLETIHRLKKHFYIGHIHPNNSLPLATVNGHTLPPLIEVTFIRKDLVEGAKPVNEIKPTAGLDWPNKTDRPDIWWARSC